MTGATEQSEGASVVAHRGLAGRYPENTLSAFRAASARPDVDAVELDVMPTADGEVVVFHDDTLARLTGAPAGVRNRPVWTLDYAHLRSYEILDSGESIPRLAEVLAVVPSSVAVNVELKHPGREIVEDGPLDESTLARERERWRPFVDRVLGTFAGSPHDVLVSSFHEAALAAVRNADPSVPVAAVFLDSVADGLTVARRHDTEYLHVPRNMLAGTSLFNESYVGGPYEAVDLLALAREEDRRVNVWTVTEPEQGRELALAGVDGLITDVPVPDVRPTDRSAHSAPVPAADGAD
jgi:glycerophosphoryl diester phosphodiesterase